MPLLDLVLRLAQIDQCSEVVLRQIKIISSDTMQNLVCKLIVEHIGKAHGLISFERRLLSKAVVLAVLWSTGIVH
jgi:hypothetical protein